MTRTPHSHHSTELKEQALLKARHRSTRCVISVAGELNMSAGTLRKWLQSASKKTGTTAQPVLAAIAALDGPASAWSPAQRLMAPQQSYALDDMARVGWCREHGVFEHQLTQWRENCCTPAVPASREATGAAKKFPGAAGGRGHMTSVPQRQELLGLIDKACADGARSVGSAWMPSMVTSVHWASSAICTQRIS